MGSTNAFVTHSTNSKSYYIMPFAVLIVAAVVALTGASRIPDIVPIGYGESPKFTCKPLADNLAVNWKYKRPDGIFWTVMECPNDRECQIYVEQGDNGIWDLQIKSATFTMDACYDKTQCHFQCENSEHDAINEFSIVVMDSLESVSVARGESWSGMCPPKVNQFDDQAQGTWYNDTNRMPWQMPNSDGIRSRVEFPVMSDSILRCMVNGKAAQTYFITTVAEDHHAADDGTSFSAQNDSGAKILGPQDGNYCGAGCIVPSVFLVIAVCIIIVLVLVLVVRHYKGNKP